MTRGSFGEYQNGDPRTSVLGEVVLSDRGNVTVIRIRLESIGRKVRVVESEGTMSLKNRLYRRERDGTTEILPSPGRW